MTKKLIAFAFLALAVTGCTQRFITAQTWQLKDNDKIMYSAYLESSCFGGYCTTADSRVKACTLNVDNTMTCKNLADAEKVLNPD